MMAPRQPRKPVTITMVPMAMTRLAADNEGKLGEKVAKLPWDTESQMPTPSSPQPQSQNIKLKRNIMYFKQQRQPLAMLHFLNSVLSELPANTLAADK